MVLTFLSVALSRGGGAERRAFRLYPLTADAERSSARSIELSAFAGGLSAVRTNARQVVEVFRHANPGEMPYEQASLFELVINLNTAKALGLEIPADMLVPTT
jgi:hypothetical protein